MMSIYNSPEEVRTAAAKSLGFGQDPAIVTADDSPLAGTQISSDGSSATLPRMIPDDESVSKAEAILADVSQSVLADISMAA